MAAEAPDRYQRAARRWSQRLVAEQEELTLEQAQLAIACLVELRLGDTDRLADVLRVLAGGRHGLKRKLALTPAEWGPRSPRTQIVAIGAAGGIDANLLEETFDGCLSSPASAGGDPRGYRKEG